MQGADQRLYRYGELIKALQYKTRSYILVQFNGDWIFVVSCYKTLVVNEQMRRRLDQNVFFLSF